VGQGNRKEEKKEKTDRTIEILLGKVKGDIRGPRIKQEARNY